jgi:hypothetical protein
MHPDELARLIDRELKRLPAPSAPETLLPRVMAAVRRRPVGAGTPGVWSRWPLAVRALTAAASLAVLAGLWWVGPFVRPAIAAALEGTAVQFWWAMDVWQRATAMSTAVDVLWRTLVQPIGWVLLPLVLLMWFACAAFGAALDRVALGGATQS